MNRSLNEIEALAKRAARGGGMSWGMSEEAARAVRWLASFRLPGPEALVELLDQGDAIGAPGSLAFPWIAEAGALCPISAGTLLADCAQTVLADGRADLKAVSQPILLLPFVASVAALHDRTVELSTQGVRFLTDGAAIEGGRAFDKSADASVQFGETMVKPTGPVLRGEVADDIWDGLSAYAHRTYAPATEESRLRGAGSGTSEVD